MKPLIHPDQKAVDFGEALLVCGDRIVGGDVSSDAQDGFMHGFAPDSARFVAPKAAA